MSADPLTQLVVQALANAPYAILLFLQLRTVYEDWQKDRGLMREERTLLINKLDALTTVIDHLAYRAGIPPSDHVDTTPKSLQ